MLIGVLMKTKLALLIGLFFLATGSQAELIRWEVKVGITGLAPAMVGYVNLGDVITLRYTFESSTLDSEPGVIERGKYDDAVTGAEIFLNSTYARLENVGYITVLNDFFGRDEYLTSTTHLTVIGETLPSYNGFEFSGYNLSYVDFHASMFSGVGLTIDPIIAGYDRFRFNLNFLKPIAPNTFSGASIVAEDLISISRISPAPVPELGSFWLLATGLLCLFGIAGQRNRVIR